MSVKNVSLRSLIFEDRLGLVYHNRIITLDCIHFHRMLEEMIDIREDWSNVVDVVKKVVKKFRVHGVFPPSITEKVYTQLDTTDKTINDIIGLLQNFGQFPTPKKSQSNRQTTNLKLELP